MDYKFVSPLNSYVDALTPSAMVFGSGAFVRHLGSDEVMGVEPPWWNWCPYKGIKGPELSLSFPHVRIQQEVSCLQQQNPTMLAPWSWDFGLQTGKSKLFFKPSSLWSCVIAAWGD